MNSNMDNNKNGNNLTMDLDTLTNFISSTSDKYSEYPLSLLKELNNIINAELLFIFALLYILIVRSILNYFNKKSLNLSNKKVEKVLLFIRDRYNGAWSKYEKFFSIFIIILLIYSIILSKLCIYVIFNN
jgi:hypothetical protein